MNNKLFIKAGKEISVVRLEPATDSPIYEMIRIQMDLEMFKFEHPTFNNEDINTIIKIGIRSGAETLEEAYNVYKTISGQ